MSKLKILEHLVGQVAIDDDLLPQEGAAVYSASFPCWDLEARYASSMTDIEKAEVVLAWSFDAPATEKQVVTWDDIVLHPTLQWYTEMYANGKFGDVYPEYKLLPFEAEGLLGEMLAKVLKFGTINGKAYEAPTFEMVAHLALMQMSSQERFTAVQSWHQREGRDIQSVAWMFQPIETAHLGPIPRVKREERAAFGNMAMVNGVWQFYPVAKAEVGRQADLLFEQRGIAVAVHDKGAYASAGGVHVRDDGLIVVPTGDPKKGQQREVLAAGTSTGIANPHNSYLCREMADGSILPVASGTRQSVAISSSATAMPLSGGAYIRRGHTIPVIETRTFNVQVLKRQDVVTSPGMKVKPGQSIVGIPDVGVYDLPYPATVQSVVRRTNDGISDTVVVKLGIEVNSAEPKLRSGGGIKCSCHPAIPMGIPEVMEDLDVDLFIGVEALKGQLPLLQLCADTCQRKMVINKEGLLPDDDQDFFDSWLAINQLDVIMPVTATKSVQRFIAAAGQSVNEEHAQTWVGEMVLEVETPVTELRAGRTAPTLLAWLDIARRYGKDFPATQSNVYDYRGVVEVTGADVAEAIELPWGEALELLAGRYPNGAFVSNGGAFVSSLNELGTLEHVVSYIDFRALRSFTAGRISGDDAMSIALSEALQNKVEQGKVFTLFKAGKASWRELRDITEELGRSLNFFNSAARGFILGGKMLRDITRPAKKSTLLTARAYNHIPEREVWVSPATAEEFNLKEGQLYWMARFPGASSIPLTLKIKEGFTLGVAVVNSYTMQVGNGGDVDGDQLYLTSHKDIATLYASNWRQRDTVMRILCMVAANNGVFFDAVDAEMTKPKWAVKRVDVEAEFDRAESAYLRHGGIQESSLTGFLGKADLTQKSKWTNGKSGLMDLGDLKPNADTGAYDALIQFGTKGVGSAYSVMFNLGIIEQIMPSTFMRSARELGASLYEDVFLAGYKPAKWGIFQALQTVEAKDMAERSSRITNLSLALLDGGFDASSSDATGVYMARAMHTSFGKNKAHAGLVGPNLDWNHLTPLVQAFRAMTSGMPSLLVDADQWEDVGQFIPANTPLRQVYDSVKEIVTVFLSTSQAQNENESEDDFFFEY